MKNLNQQDNYNQQVMNPLTYGVVSRPIAYTHDIFIDKELIQPLDWRLELDTIRNASPNDVVNLRINCPGGSDMVMGAFIKAIAECQGHVVGHIEHTCASAATIIFLACHEFVVSDDAEFMVHTSSLGYGGKQNNFNEYAIFVNKSNERLMRKYYEGFLSEEEIDLTLKGADLWMNSEEVVERLEKKITKESEQEPQPLTREVAQELSKEELIEILFGSEEQSENTVDYEAFSNGDNDSDANLEHIHSWTEAIVLWKEKDSGEYLFEVEGIEYTVSDDKFKEYVKEDMDINEARSICDHMSIRYSMSNTQSQLMQKIFNEVKSKI